MGVFCQQVINSRSGIKSLQLSEQMSMNYKIMKDRKGEVAWNEKNKTQWVQYFSSRSVFVKPSYIPAVRPQITIFIRSGKDFNWAEQCLVFMDHLDEGYGQVFIDRNMADRTLKKPMVGYLYAQNAKSNPNS
jgi:hypothetical protein